MKIRSILEELADQSPEAILEETIENSLDPTTSFKIGEEAVAVGRRLVGEGMDRGAQDQALDLDPGEEVDLHSEAGEEEEAVVEVDPITGVKMEGMTLWSSVAGFGEDLEEDPEAVVETGIEMTVDVEIGVD
jgi:hypothetical protein